MGAPQLTGQVAELQGQTLLLSAVPMGLGNFGQLHIASEGEWLGHSGGEIQFNADVFDAMVQQFEAQKNPLSVDYDHRSFNELNPDSTAAGWIQKLETRRGDNGLELWALVEWTDNAAAKIKAGEYKFCSPAFRLADKDRKTGETTGPRLRNVALTNDPFLDGNTPIQLSFRCAVSQAEDKPMPPAQQPPADPAAEQPPPAQDPQADALNQQLTAAIDAMAQTMDVDRAAVVSALNEYSDAIAGYLRDKLDADGMPQEDKMAEQDKTPAEDPKAKADKIEASARANDGTIALSQVQELATKLSAIEAERKAEKEAAKAAQDAANAARVKSMTDAGYLLDAEKDDALWMLSNAPDRFERVYGSRKTKAVPIGEQQAGDEPAKGNAKPEPIVDAHAYALSRGLAEGEELGTFNFLCRQGGWDPKKAADRVIARRARKAG